MVNPRCCRKKREMKVMEPARTRGKEREGGDGEKRASAWERRISQTLAKGVKMPKERRERWETTGSGSGRSPRSSSQGFASQAHVPEVRGHLRCLL